MLSRSGPIVALTVAALLPSFSSPAQDDRQDQPPVFRVEVNILPVDVIVTDADGDFLSGLTVEDFELFDNGEARDIQTFRLVELPALVEATPTEGTALREEPDYGVETNDGVELGRLYVLVMDDLHVRAERTARVQALARRFIHHHLGPGDLVAIAFTSGRARGFTARRSSLLGSIDQFMGKKLRSATMDRLEAQAQAQAGGNPASDNPTPHTAIERGQMAADTLRALRAHCEWLKPIRGRRKALIWISEGLDYDISNVLGQPYSERMLREFPKLLDEAARANVAIYALDPGGLNSIGDDLLHVATGSGSVVAPSVYDSILSRGSAFPDEQQSLGTDSLLEDRGNAVGSLRTISELTGGFTVANNNNLGASLDRIVEDTRRYYLLGFTPTDDGTAGEVRRIDVRVKRDGVRVRTRHGYTVAEKEDASSAAPSRELAESKEISDAARRPVPVTGLSLQVVATPLGEADNVALVPVVVHADTTAFGFEEKDGRLHDDVVVWVGALRHTGEIVDSQTNRARLRIPVGLRSRIRRDGFRSTTVLRVPPGSYQLRVVVHETGAGRTGSVLSHLEVPKSEEGFLRGVALSSKIESRVPMAGREGDLATLPGPLSATRRFRQDDELIAYVELVNPSGRELRLVMALSSDDGHTVTRFEDEPSDSAGKSVSIVSRRFPLSGLARGGYRLDIRALSLDGRELGARRATFTVR